MAERAKKQPFEFGPEPRKPRSSRARRYLSFAVTVLLLAGAGAAALFYLRPGFAPRLPEWLEQTALLPQAEVTQLFQWQDADGRWHVSDQPPAAGIAYERLEYRHDTNILPRPPELQDLQD